MWIYEKKLEYPARVTKKTRMAKFLVTIRGPDGELSASCYLNQRYSMPTERAKGTRISAPKNWHTWKSLPPDL